MNTGQVFFFFSYTFRCVLLLFYYFKSKNNRYRLTHYLESRSQVDFGRGLKKLKGILQWRHRNPLKIPIRFFNAGLI